MTKEELKNLFVKRCTTIHNAVNDDTGEPILYLRDDLSLMAKKACERGEKFFHCKAVVPHRFWGELVECEPEYEYILSRSLTEEEFDSLFKE